MEEAIGGVYEEKRLGGENGRGDGETGLGIRDREKEEGWNPEEKGVLGRVGGCVYVTVVCVERSEGLVEERLIRRSARDRI